ncbi:MAG: 1-acyl-sn-glycerol-3-phosphate acyltransferase [Planctomycetes bacterium]|nr:1-acyl-sn-glycerol-3-phosphate acyltransferase [Planctomycetota bacterium]
MSQGLYIGLMQGRAYHRERVPPSGGLLVVSNHQSYLDPILVALPIPRPFNPMARASLFRNPLFSWLIRSLYAFPVRRGSADLTAIKEAIRRLRRGEIVLVFPEGTRTRDGSIGRLQAGLVLIAQRAKVPIMPAVVDGAYECWPRQRTLPTWHPLKVGYGEITAADVVQESDPEQLVADLRQQMVELQAELRGQGA